MISKQTLAKLLFLLTIILTVLPKIVRAEEDEDDDIIGELIIDLFVGIAMATCETNETCSKFMTIIAVAIMIFSIISCCITGCKCDKKYKPNGKTLRRAGTIGIGYGISRRILKRH